MGCPIKGDVKYGFPMANRDGSIALHARKLEFEHPVKRETLILEAPLPETPVWKMFATLGK
jgi:23S rRNA pseudouridine1911/1915/1917 synthase